MKTVVVLLAAIVALATPAYADNAVPQFQVDPFWPKPLPNNWILGQVSGIATDRYDRVWVVHRPGTLTARERAAEQSPPEAKCCIAAPPVLVFDQAGNLIRHWGAYGKQPSDEKIGPYNPERPPSQQFGNPVHCVRIDKDGLVYVCDRANNRLQVFRKDGTFVLEHIYEKMTRGSGSMFDLVFSPDKDQEFIYMVDGMNGEIRIVERASKETLGRFGRPGRQVGMFTVVHNIAVDRQGNIFTSEVNTGQRVQKFRRTDMQD